MSPLQWALLVIGAVAVIAVYVVSRRERTPAARPPRRPPSAMPTDRPSAASATPADQMDMFSRTGEFDEFGVGRPRKRVAPPMPGTGGAAVGSEVPPSAPAVADKLVTLLIAEREGTAIFGPKIHAALQAQALQFGDKKIYHRVDNQLAVFSVASLLKPGYLDPSEQQGFSTPGLSVFMLLPGPRRPEVALADMIGTARALAQQLNAEVYDGNRQPLTPAVEQALVADVRAWAASHKL